MFLLIKCNKIEFQSPQYLLTNTLAMMPAVYSTYNMYISKCTNALYAGRQALIGNLSKRSVESYDKTRSASSLYNALNGRPQKYEVMFLRLI